MDRSAIMIYLRDLRDLEIAKERLSRMLTEEQSQFNENYNRLTSTNIKTPPELHGANPIEAAKYGEISARSRETVAYFAQADYFRKIID